MKKLLCTLLSVAFLTVWTVIPIDVSAQPARSHLVPRQFFSPDAENGTLTEQVFSFLRMVRRYMKKGLVSQEERLVMVRGLAKQLPLARALRDDMSPQEDTALETELAHVVSRLVGRQPLSLEAYSSVDQAADGVRTIGGDGVNLLKDMVDLETVNVFHPKRGPVEIPVDFSKAEGVLITMDAGQGNRLNNSMIEAQDPRQGTPKLLLTAGGLPVGMWSKLEAQSLGWEVVSVVGHGARRVMNTYNGYQYGDFGITYVEVNHTETFKGGTGSSAYHVAAVKKLIEANPVVVVVAGDQPTIDRELLKQVWHEFDEGGADLIVTASEFDSAQGKGRIVMDRQDGRTVLGIMEQKDIDGMGPEEERFGYNKQELQDIKTGNISVYAARARRLFEVLAHIDDDNKQREFYITDAVARINAEGGKIRSVIVGEEYAPDVTRINDLDTLVAPALSGRFLYRDALNKAKQIARDGRVEVTGDLQKIFGVLFTASEGRQEEFYYNVRQIVKIFARLSIHKSSPLPAAGKIRTWSGLIKLLWGLRQSQAHALGRVSTIDFFHEKPISDMPAPVGSGTTLRAQLDVLQKDVRLAMSASACASCDLIDVYQGRVDGLEAALRWRRFYMSPSKNPVIWGHVEIIRSAHAPQGFSRETASDLADLAKLLPGFRIISDEPGAVLDHGRLQAIPLQLPVEGARIANLNGRNVMVQVNKTVDWPVPMWVLRSHDAQALAYAVSMAMEELKKIKSGSMKDARFQKQVYLRGVIMHQDIRDPGLLSAYLVPRRQYTDSSSSDEAGVLLANDTLGAAGFLTVRDRHAFEAIDRIGALTFLRHVGQTPERLEAVEQKLLGLVRDLSGDGLDRGSAAMALVDLDKDLSSLNTNFQPTRYSGFSEQYLFREHPYVSLLALLDRAIKQNSPLRLLVDDEIFDWLTRSGILVNFSNFIAQNSKGMVNAEQFLQLVVLQTGPKSSVVRPGGMVLDVIYADALSQGGKISLDILNRLLQGRHSLELTDFNEMLLSRQIVDSETLEQLYGSMVMTILNTYSGLVEVTSEIATLGQRLVNFETLDWAA